MAQFTFNGNAAGFAGAVAVIFGLVWMVFWMVVAWRAMRAHEKIAEAQQKKAHFAARGHAQSHDV